MKRKSIWFHIGDLFSEIIAKYQEANQLLKKMVADLEVVVKNKIDSKRKEIKTVMTHRNIG